MLNMATLPSKEFFAVGNHEEEHSVIRFLQSKGLGASDINFNVHPVYGDKCFTRSAMHLWCKKSAYGYIDSERPCCHVSMMQRSQLSLLSHVVTWE